MLEDWLWRVHSLGHGSIEEKNPECDAEHLVDILGTYVLHVGHSVAFDLGCYAGVGFAQAIRGIGLAWNLVCSRASFRKLCTPAGF